MNDNKTIKVLRIITLTLSLMLLVFALMKKIGLAADSGQNPLSFNSFPLPFGLNTYMGYDTSNSTLVNYLNSIDFDYAIDYGISQGLPSDIDTVVIQEVGSRYLTLGLVKSNGITYSSISSTDIKPMNTTIHYNYRYLIRYDMQSGNTNFSFWGGYAGDYVCDLTNSNILLPDGSVPAGVTIINYPIYSKVTNLVSNTDDKVLFSPSSHSTGGGLAEYSDEVQDFIDSQLNDVDVNAPSNNTSVPAWLQSILNGIGTLNNTIGGGFSWIKKGINNIFGAISDFSDTVVDGFSSIVGKLDDVITSIEGNSGDYETVAGAWVDCYEDSLIYDFISEFSVVDASLKSLANTSPASSVSFSIGLPSWNVPNVSGSGSSNILANHNSISFNFDWYTVPRYANGDSIRDRIWLVFIPFILVGFMWRLLSKIPSILGGNSGLSEGVHKTIEVSSIYANKSN